jgi:hypothetical protein
MELSMTQHRCSLAAATFLVTALVGAKKTLEARLASHGLNPEDIFSDNAKLLFK